MADDKKKIIVDEDWKEQAQKEKEELKEKEKVEHEKEPQPRPQMPEANFSGLVSMLATQAFYALGLIRPEGDEDKKVEPDWDVAKFNIDMLGMLEEKCKGNLTDEEAGLIKSSLDQLRMLFVQLSKKD
ncbi:MAG: hypothetical protein B6I25_01495 [Planctomycetales bacterium 4572_13]|nr:MAG: hypothetical protein B6I25_01495 [Planctomycetales bacterium 4572_13]